MLLLETIRKSAFRRHMAETHSERGRQSSVGEQRAVIPQGSKRSSVQDDDIDFLTALRRQKGLDAPTDDEE